MTAPSLDDGDTKAPSTGVQSTRALVTTAVLVAFVAGAALLPVREYLAVGVAWIAAHPGLAVFAYFFAYVVAAVFVIPAFPLTLAAGFIFGLLKGVALVSISSVAGATAAFLLGRTLARSWVTRAISRQPRFSALDRAIRSRGFWVVLLTRLSPAFPFNILNYLYGVTSVSIRSYVLGSWLGMLPATILYVYVGSLAGSLGSVFGRHTGRSPATYVLLGVGLVATFIVTILVTRLASRELNKTLE